MTWIVDFGWMTWIAETYKLKYVSLSLNLDIPLWQTLFFLKILKNIMTWISNFIFHKNNKITKLMGFYRFYFH